MYYRVDYLPEEANPASCPYHVHRGMGALHWFQDEHVAERFCSLMNEGAEYHEALLKATTHKC